MKLKVFKMVERLDARRNSRKQPDVNKCTCGVEMSTIFAKDNVGVIKLRKVD